MQRQQIQQVTYDFCLHTKMCCEQKKTQKKQEDVICKMIQNHKNIRIFWFCYSVPASLCTDVWRQIETLQTPVAFSEIVPPSHHGPLQYLCGLASCYECQPVW
mmetsp:Transcript_147403/g.257672  ORF Transcript_147403/g.257672 Transcript_147403/m.257672 type:complete len:103 (-) Transcript_147403:556-864(-)